MNSTLYIRLFPTLILLLLAAGVSLAQGPEIVLKGYFSEIRAGASPAIPSAVLQSQHADAVLAALPAYQQDTVAAVRAGVYTLLHRTGTNAKQRALRQNAVTQLTHGCRDKDSGNAGSALDYLTTFRREDFTREAIDTVSHVFAAGPPHVDQVLKLVGFLEMTELKTAIRSHTQAGKKQSVRWAALVSLARMNDADAIKEVVQRVRKLPVNDDLIYKIFPDLVYTRHPEAIAYMVEVLYNDDKNCLSADAENEQAIPCGYRIMEQLAPVIDGYPLQLDESGDVKTTDYIAALKTVREWFAKHPNYKILRDRY